MDILPHLLLAVALVAVAAAAVHDLAARTIPNGVVLAVAILGIGLRLTDGTLAAAAMAALLVFLLGVLAWRAGALGGGDVKLIAACALLCPPALVPTLVLAIALAGGVLALAYLGARAFLARPGEGAMVAPLSSPAAGPSLLARVRRAEAWRVRRGGPLPYGIAILGGILFTCLA